MTSSRCVLFVSVSLLLLARCCSFVPPTTIRRYSVLQERNFLVRPQGRLPSTNHAYNIAKNNGLDLSERSDRNAKVPFGPGSFGSMMVSSFLLPFLLSFSTVATLPALAITTADTTSTLDASIFTNDYADPLHPFCKRHIDVSADGKTFHYSGTAVGPKDDTVLRGCSKKEIVEFGLRQGAFDGNIILEGLKVSVGDGIHEGVWEPAGSASTSSQKLGYEDVDGIRWNDGNKWTVQMKSLATKAGELIFLSYIGFSLLAGINGLYKAYQKQQGGGTE